MNSKITIILTAHKSKKLVLNHLKNLYDYFKIIVIDNSNDLVLKKEISQKYPNVIFRIMDNNGYGAAVNYAVKFVDSKYFLVSNPDVVGMDVNNVLKFEQAASKLNDKFSILGPIDLDLRPKKIKNIYKSELIEKKRITGICMFIHKKIFDLIGGFDENIFLYYEDDDICKRSCRYSKNYLLSSVRVHHIAGTSVISENIYEKNKQDDLRMWHYIWSKFYYHKKHYGYILSLIFFLPVIIRINFRILLYKIINDQKKLNKYSIRWSGLKTSIFGIKSFKRI
jgi:N-acetylglucosaminyl-diphospho-decaprenol L-rhamnosyltransferase